MLKIKNMEKFESIQRKGKTSAPQLISSAHINPMGFISKTYRHSSCAPQTLQYENTYKYDSILVETYVPGYSFEGELTPFVTKYTYLLNGSIDLIHIYYCDVLISTIQHIYSIDNRLYQIEEKRHPNTLFDNFKETNKKSFFYNEIGQLTEMQEKKRKNVLRTKEVFQYIYDQQGNLIETYIKSKDIKP